MSNPLPRYDRIEGLTPRDPIGAVLTVGTKGPSGNPTETDRFFFKVADSTKIGEHLVKPLHPSFASFNEAELKHRQMVSGNLVHATQDEAFHYALSAQVLGKGWTHFPGAHPNKLPICSGDGTRATRLYGIGEDSVEDWREIECPNERCAYRQGASKPCKPAMRFLFRPRWKSGSTLPTPLTLLLSKSWNSAARFLGFFKHVEDQARQLGLQTFSLYGLPFVLSIAFKTKASASARFPVLSISPDTDLIAFFLAQREQLARIGAGAPQPLLAAKLTDPEQNDPVKVARDFEEIVPGRPLAGKPANLEPPTDPPIEGELVGSGPSERSGPSGDEEIDGRLSANAQARILAAAKSKGLTEEAIYSIAGGRLIDAPASAELAILRSIKAYNQPAAKRGH